MHLLAATLTSAALMAHALLGCCWHHAHPAMEVVPAARTATLKPVVHGDHVHWHEDEGDRSNDSDHHHGGQPGCGDAECIYAGGTPRVQIQSPLTGLDLPVIAPAFALTAGRLDTAYIAGAAVDASPRPPIHLLYQVLVI
jgi:hypothetical protein